MSARLQAAGAVLGILVAILIPLLGTDYLVSFFFTTFVFVGMAYGWNLISGYTAYVSFGQISFFGIGAYAVAILATRLAVPWPLGVLAGIASAALLAVPLGWAMLRLRGPYFALGMLGLVQVLSMVASAWPAVTNGGEGIYLPPTSSLQPLYFAAAAMAGGLNAWRISYLDPAYAFPGAYDVRVILMTIFGGAGTVWGPLVGGVLLTGIGEVLWAKFAELHLLLFGLMIVVVLRYMPQGLVPLLRRRRARRSPSLPDAAREDAA